MKRLDLNALKQLKPFLFGAGFLGLLTVGLLVSNPSHRKGLSGKADGLFGSNSCACGDADREGYCQMYAVEGNDYVPFPEAEAQAATAENSNHCYYEDCYQNFYNEYSDDPRCEQFVGIVQRDGDGRLVSQTTFPAGTWDGLQVADAPPLDDGLPAITPADFPRVNPPIEIAESPLPAPWIGALHGGRRDQGHCGVPDPYDIYSWNCHSNTNRAIASVPANEKRGACICNDGAINTPAWHSFAWSMFTDDANKKWTCIWNYGQACCYEGDTNPPDLSRGDGNRCAQWACNFDPTTARDDQYTPGRTRCLPEGQQVEIPGPAACARQVLGNAPNSASIDMDQIINGQRDVIGNRQACLSCCDQRANLWGGTQPGFQQQFLNSCRSLCRGHFGDSQNLGTEYGNQCAANTSAFSLNSYYEQCRGCCLDGVGNDIARQDLGQCLSVCRGLQ